MINLDDYDYNCVEAVQKLYTAHWQVEATASGPYWLELYWQRGAEEHQLMMIYGAQNIKTVGQLLQNQP